MVIATEFVVNLRRSKHRDNQPESAPDTDLDLDAVAKAVVEVASAALGQPVELAEGPEPVPAGHGPDAYRFSLATDDPHWTGTLLARCTEPEALDREATWTRAVRAAGFPAPEPLAHSPGHGALVLREPTGKSLLECMLTDMSSVPRLLAELGELHARLHSLPTEGLDLHGTVDDGDGTAADRASSPAAREDLAEELAWLDANVPSPARTVVCHNQLYPVNIFVDPEDTSSAVVFNWTAARLAGPERDVANTMTAFWFAPFYLENVMYRKALEMARDSLVSGYTDAYREAAPEPLDEDGLRYWQAFQVASVATDLAHHIHHGPSGPWDPMTAVIKPERTLEDLRKRFRDFVDI